MKIAFTGYMGSGKSFWAKRIAQELKVDFIDLDHFLEQEFLEMTINDFVNQKGEMAFRKMERNALLELGALEKSFVLALGGGTPCYYDNMGFLNVNFFTIFLNTSIKTLAARLIEHKNHRPLISHLPDAEMQEFVAKHIFERRPFYLLADYILNENHINLKNIMDAIQKEMDK